MTLRRKAFSGVRWTSLSSVGRAVLQLLQVTVLARLLSPADFGSVAIVAALVAILQVLASVGISSALIYFQDVTRRELDSLYWFNFGVGSLLTVVLFFASPAIAELYDDGSLTPLVQLSAAALIATSFGQQLRVMAQRSLRFSALASVDLGGALVGFCVAVCAALLGAGAIALVAGSVAAAAATSLLAWVYLADGWRPSVRMKWREVKRFVDFGAFNVGSNLVSTLNMQVDVLVAGRVMGAAQIGSYNVSKDLSLRVAGFINPIVTEVSLPVMAAAQEDLSALRRLYLQLMRMTMSVTFPAYAVLATFAPEIVQIVFGSGWEGAGALLRTLALWGLLRAIGNPVGTLILARGQPRMGFIWNVTQLVLLSPIVYVASQFGARELGLSMLAFVGLLYLPNWWFLVRPLCGATLQEYTQAIAIPMIISAVAAMISYLSVIPVSGEAARLILGAITGMVAYMTISYRWNRHWFLAIAELIGYRKSAKEDRTG